jgi:hypothetical protein
MTEHTNKSSNPFIQIVRHPLKFRWFLFSRLPSAFFSGVRVKEMNEFKSAVTVPYTWFSQNPFRSTYFACLAMAAEMSTGILALTHIYKRKPAVSMLIVKMEAAYFKKGVGLTTFVCEDGQQLQACIEKAIATGDGQSFTAKSVGKNVQQELVAEFLITWSFKVRSR